MRLSPRKQLTKQLGSFSLRDSKSMAEIEKAKELYDLMCANDREEVIKKPQSTEFAHSEGSPPFIT